MKRTLLLLLGAALLAGFARASAAPQPAEPEELTLPAIPGHLRQPAERASYLVRHFWENLDFGDTARSHDMLFLEQNFANFISVFPYAGEAACSEAVETLLRRAEADSTAYGLVADIAERYLYSDDSPLRSEDYYILFLEHLSEAPLLGEYGTIRYRYQLEAARKNRPGSVAADFGYTTPDGQQTSLHATPADDRLLLIFYDPDCAHCKEVMDGLQADPELSRAVAAGRLQVLAVYSGDRPLLWRRSTELLPADWILGYNAGDIYDDERYALHRMPTLYLLDRDCRVLLKDPNPEDLIGWLQEQ